METISIIIPIYNQEKYLEKCLSSIEKQNYKDFEVLMVDDGSTDGSEKICQDYQIKDSRFKHIRQKNSGVAAARNTGLDHVSGNLIGFIDPDDWIEPDFYQRLIELLHLHNADIVSCGRMEVFDEEMQKSQKKNTEILVCDKDRAMCLLSENTVVKSHLWNRIYNPKVWEGVRFEEGRVYEDVWVLHQVFDKADKFVFTDEPLYYYRQHPSSIVRAVTLQKQIDHCYAHQCRYEYIVEKYPETRQDIVRNYEYEILGLVDIMVASTWKAVLKYSTAVKKTVEYYTAINGANKSDKKIYLLKKNVFIATAYYKLRKYLKKL